MNAIVAFWLGGALASAMIFAAELAADNDQFNDVGDNIALLVSLIFWPVTVVWFLIDVARGWRG